MNLTGPILTTLIFLIPLNALAESQLPAGPSSMEECIVDSDCVLAPVVFSGCFHFCQGEECKDANACPAINKNFTNFPNCARNVPCKEVSGKLSCIDKRCVVKELDART